MKIHLSPQAWTAIALSCVAAGTFVAGVCIPPPGEVHPTVLKGIGLMIVLVAIFFAWDAVVRGLDARFEHGQTKVTISNPDNPKSDKNATDQ